MTYTREQILAMEPEELSLTVAEHVFNARIVENHDYGSAYILVGDVGRNSTQPLKGKDWSSAKWRNSEEKAWLDCPKYAENMSDAWEIEEKIKWMAAMGKGLMIGHYMVELTEIVGNYGFELVHATPAQRSKAALLAVLDL